MRNCIFLALCLFTFVDGSSRADDWPQYFGPKRDAIWREKGIIDTLPKEPKYLWRKEVGEGYAGPAVADGRVFVTDLIKNGGPKKNESKERVLCLDEKTGDTLWKQEYDVTYRVSYPAGPRCTPTVDGDRVYTLGAMGNLLCLDVKKGDILWQKNFLKDYNAKLPIWGFSSHPLIDGDKLICLVAGSEGRGVIAFDKKTGDVKWSAIQLEGDPGYCVPVIYTLGGVRQLIIWHPRAIVSLDPDTGKRLWSEPWQIQAAVTIAMPRIDGDRLFLSAFYNGSIFLKVEADKATIIWKSKKPVEKPEQTEELHSLMVTPFLKDGHIYGVCSYGELRCLKLETGERLWMTHEPVAGVSARWANAFIIPHEDRYFLFNEKGELLICKLSPEKFEEVSRMKILEPTNTMTRRAKGVGVVWMHPAFANKNCYARNDKEIVCVSLAK
ncbi:MAG: PQQ-like beta-propeller repeat protein [Planctomycetes bacterium]|nr:PQQ-like beta-propeller repeat protein [Planctomycetota bacterium]